MAGFSGLSFGPCLLSIDFWNKSEHRKQHMG